MKRVVVWGDRRGLLVREAIGRVLVLWDDTGKESYVLKGLPHLEIIDVNTGGRPRKFKSDSEKQRAYRERQKGKALRNYRRGTG